jgi:hypothetical protein
MTNKKTEKNEKKRRPFFALVCQEDFLLYLKEKKHLPSSHKTNLSPSS